MSARIDAGAGQVRTDLIAFLRAEFPDALETARNLWDVTETELPAPARWNEYEDEVVGDQTPSIAVSLGRSDRYVRRAYDDAVAQVYRVRYAIRLFAWLKATGGDVTRSEGGEAQGNPSQRMRDRYAQVLAGVLLDQPSLGQPGVFQLDEESLVIDYSDAARLRGDRYLSGVSLTFDLTHVETLRRLPLGSVERPIVEATVLSNGTPS